MERSAVFSAYSSRAGCTVHHGASMGMPWMGTATTLFTSFAAQASSCDFSPGIDVDTDVFIRRFQAAFNPVRYS